MLEVEVFGPKHDTFSYRAPDQEEFDGITRCRWNRAQFIVDQLWQRWMKESSLIERKKGKISFFFKS